MKSLNMLSAYKHYVLLEVICLCFVCSHDTIMDLHTWPSYLRAGRVGHSILSNCYVCHWSCHSFGRGFPHTEVSSTCDQNHGSDFEAILNTADSLHCHICHSNKPLLVWTIYVEGEMCLYIILVKSSGNCLQFKSNKKL